MRTTKWFLAVAVLILATACKPEAIGGVGVREGGGGSGGDSITVGQPTLRR